MKRVRFGRCNQEVSRVALGAWSFGGPHMQGRIPIGWGAQDDQGALGALERAYAGGITHWDTADGSGGGDSERLIGSVWDRVPRSEIFLATKVGWVKGDYPHFYHPAQMRLQLETSLRSLKTETIDLYYLHHCEFGRDDQHLDPALEQIQRFRDEGKIRFVGLSDWSSEKILRLCPRVDPDVVQPYRNAFEDGYAASGLADWIREADLGVAFFSPLKHGLLLGKYSQPPKFEEGDMRSRVREFQDQALLDRFRDAVRQIEQHFEHPQAVLHALTGVLLSDSPSASVLLGQRNADQAAAAALLGDELDAPSAAWVRSLYRD
jgi:aryl-alcohol dehydrogenase-like predicted oxidoreductase